MVHNRRPIATQATVRRHIEAARKAGLTIAAIKPDGTVLVSDGDTEIPALPGIEHLKEDADARRWGDG